MTGLPITLTFTFDDMAQAERAIAAVRRATTADLDAATETSSDDLREPTAVVSGQIAGEGDASRETGRRTDGVASRPSSVSQMDGGAIAAVKGRARPASVVDAEPSPSSSLNPFIAIRPNCQKPEHCSGYGRNHCHACKVKAAAEAEAA